MLRYVGPAVRNKQAWKPTKFVLHAGSGRYVPNPDHVGVGSRFIASLQIDAYVPLLNAYASGLLLDCGCGDVPFYELYKDLVTDNVCVDWVGSVHGNNYVDEFVDLNGPLPFEDDSFDTVLLTDVLAHIATPSDLFASIARVLRPGGALIAGMPFFYWIAEAPHDYYRYTEFALRRLCAENGLEVVHLQAYGGYPDVVLDLVNKKLVPGERTAGAFLGLCRFLTRRGAYRRLRERTKANFPLGYCLVARKPTPDAAG
jgi:SAM-dependent methyltransferase